MSGPAIQHNTKPDENKFVLRSVWERFALYDENANRLQRYFSRLQICILALGVVATILALSQTQFKSSLEPLVVPNTALKDAILIMPITISILVAAANRFKYGTKWVQLRASAEAIKSEIYRYRTKAEKYSDQHREQASRDEVLSNQIKIISQRLMQSEVNVSSLEPFSGPIPPKMFGAEAQDDGLSDLTAESYITIRVADQLTYYKRKTTKMSRTLTRLQLLIYVIGGIGTFLAAVGLQLWVALTIALVGALTTFLEYRQLENNLMKYNQAVTTLDDVKVWWMALSSQQKTISENVDKLVGSAETILQSELTGWMQQMENALAKITKQESNK